jgi:Ca2+-binding EF-hand superfamily protein
VVIDKADLGLSRSEVALLLAEADVSGDGQIDYSEFVHVALQVR